MEDRHGIQEMTAGYGRFESATGRPADPSVPGERFPAFARCASPDLLLPVFRIRQYRRQEEIVAQEGVPDFAFWIVSGCVRTVRQWRDGRRQIGEFLMAGDLFDRDDIGRGRFGAEAVSPTRALCVRVSALQELAARQPCVAIELRQHAVDRMRRTLDRLILLGRMTASERIACFLIEMNERLGAEGTIDLPMNRTDIADYLGLTIETVCRGLAVLRQRGAIAIDRSRITIFDRCALERAERGYLN